MRPLPSLLVSFAQAARSPLWRLAALARWAKVKEAAAEPGERTAERSAAVRTQARRGAGTEARKPGRLLAET